MRRAEYSETWTSRPASRFVAADLLALSGDAPFVALHGDGPRERWLVFAEDPLAAVSAPEDFGSPGDPAFSVVRRGDAPELAPDFVGYATYEYACAREPLAGTPPPDPIPLPPFSFLLHRRCVVYDRVTGTLHECARSGPRLLEPARHSLEAGAFSARLSDPGDDRATYEGKVEAIRAMIRAGDVYQVNLTRQEEWRISGDARRFASALAAGNPAPMSAMIAAPEGAIVSSSPERLATLRAGRLSARPIKGTSPRFADPVEDEASARALLASGKDLAELAMIVDLLRNDLSRACRMPSTRVDAFPVLESFANVHHLVADVSGEVGPSFDLALAFDAIFPGGSVTGCPKLAAMKAIRSLEPLARSIYTGALGWISADLSAFDLSIPIRTAWCARSRLRYGIGGAVTWDSDPRLEWEETIHKGRSIASCLRS